MKLSLYLLIAQNLIVLSSGQICGLFNVTCDNREVIVSYNFSLSPVTPQLANSALNNEMESRDIPSDQRELHLPNVEVPDEIGTFSLAERIKALRNVFDHLISLERELVWKPLVPSRLSRSFFLVKLFSNLLKIMPFREFMSNVQEGISNRASCLTCNILANIYTSRLFTTDIIAFATRVVCVMFRLQTPRVCHGVINSFWDVVDYVRLNSHLTPSEMCGAFLGTSCALSSSNKLNWTIEIPPMRRSMAAKITTKRGKHFKVLQITDIHFDPYFSPGARTDCGEPVCCRMVNGPARTATQMASIWGDYTDCDTPFFTVQNSLQRVSTEHSDVSYWLMTGDLPPHDIWEYNRNESLAHIRFMTWLINQYSKETAVLPVIGNHEAVPINSFAPPDINNPDHDPSWLYNYTAEQWAPWLPEESLVTLRKAGHYMIQIKPGFRVVAINSNYCARLNPWILYDTVDPAGQLAFLRDQLLQAEAVGDRVHIIGHVPPDHRECTEAWLYNYMLLMKRFKDTITAQFYGHTHRDEFRVVYDVEDTVAPDSKAKNPVAFQFICPSITSYSQTNPSYRIYEVDSSSYRVENHHTYFFNLSDDQLRFSSANAQPKWGLEYSARQALRVNEMNPESMHEVLTRLNNDEDEFNEYYRRYYVKSEADVARAWDLVRKERILSDHLVTNPYTRSPASLIPV